MLWEGSLDTTVDNSISQTEEPLFDKTKQVVVAQTNVKSADGLSKVIKIVMTDGQQEDSGNEGAIQTHEPIWILSASCGLFLVSEKQKCKVKCLKRRCLSIFLG